MTCLDDYKNVDEFIVERHFTTTNLKRMFTHCESYCVIKNLIKLSLVKKHNNLIVTKKF